MLNNMRENIKISLVACNNVFYFILHYLNVFFFAKMRFDPNFAGVYLLNGSTDFHKIKFRIKLNMRGNSY